MRHMLCHTILWATLNKTCVLSHLVPLRSHGFMELLEVYKYFVTIRYTCFLSALKWRCSNALDDRNIDQCLSLYVKYSCKSWTLQTLCASALEKKNAIFRRKCREQLFYITTEQFLVPSNNYVGHKVTSICCILLLIHNSTLIMFYHSQEKKNSCCLLN